MPQVGPKWTWTHDLFLCQFVLPNYRIFFFSTHLDLQRAFMSTIASAYTLRTLSLFIIP